MRIISENITVDPTLSQKVLAVAEGSGISESRMTKGVAQDLLEKRILDVFTPKNNLNLFNRINNLSEDEMLLISPDYELGPLYTGPANSMIIPYKNELITLPVPQNRGVLRRHRQNFSDKLGVELRAINRHQADDNRLLSGSYSGVVHEGTIRHRTKKYTTILDLIRSEEDFQRHKSNLTRYKPRVLSYTAKKGVEDYGGKYIVRVPSKSKRETKTHRIELLSVPVVSEANDYSRFQVWPDFHAIHSCGKEIPVTLQYNKPGVLGFTYNDHHVLEAVKTARDKTSECDINIDDFIPRPSAELVRYADTVRNNVLRMVIYKDTDPALDRIPKWQQMDYGSGYKMAARNPTQEEQDMLITSAAIAFSKDEPALSTQYTTLDYILTPARHLQDKINVTHEGNRLIIRYTDPAGKI